MIIFTTEYLKTSWFESWSILSLFTLILDKTQHLNVDGYSLETIFEILDHATFTVDVPGDEILAEHALPGDHRFRLSSVPRCFAIEF
jgi:hypothetical protein